MKLNVYISRAEDGILTVKAVQIPELSVQAGTIAEIPDAVRSAAASISGQSPDDFVVVADF